MIFYAVDFSLDNLIDFLMMCEMGGFIMLKIPFAELKEKVCHCSMSTCLCMLTIICDGEWGVGGGGWLPGIGSSIYLPHRVIVT